MRLVLHSQAGFSYIYHRLFVNRLSAALKSTYLQILPLSSRQSSAHRMWNAAENGRTCPLCNTQYNVRGRRGSQCVLTCSGLTIEGIQGNLSNTDTLGMKQIVLISEGSLFQGQNNIVFTWKLRLSQVPWLTKVSVLISAVFFKRGSTVSEQILWRSVRVQPGSEFSR